MRTVLGLACLITGCAHVDDHRGRPNLLIVTLSGESDPGEQGDTPNAIGEFVESGMHFPHVWHPQAAPGSAAASLFTGLHNQRSPVNSRLDETTPTLAERVYEWDVWTGAAVAASEGILIEGIERGFERFQQAPDGDAAQVARTAAAWMVERSSQDGAWMIWAHLGDPEDDQGAFDAALRSMTSSAKELDPLGRTMLIVLNLTPQPSDSLHQCWAAVSLPHAVEGVCNEDLALGDFCLLAIEHLARPTWSQEARRPPGLDGVSPGLALYGLPARRGPVVFEAEPGVLDITPIALFAGWKQTTGGAIDANWSDLPSPPERVRTVLAEALEH